MMFAHNIKIVVMLKIGMELGIVQLELYLILTCFCEKMDIVTYIYIVWHKLLSWLF